MNLVPVLLADLTDGGVVCRVMSLSAWFEDAFVLAADVYVTFNVSQQKLKSFQTKGKLKVYKKC